MRKLQIQILFLVLPSHTGGGEEIAYSRDWQLDNAWGGLMRPEPDTSWVTGALPLLVQSVELN